ncbi:MAG TPA: kelch repeat-containing protein [Planctomycetota bacterium]|nr:kelch repeat-containing protein [Planctomycetota bacterium]HQA99679.1 kelch repeat-containing protein [Planctomycetota bacterium]
MKVIIFFLCMICSIFCLADEWKTITIESPQLPEMRMCHSMVEYGGKYYIACGGGVTSQTSLADIWCVEMTDSSPMITNIYTPDLGDEFQGTGEHATAVMGDKLYVLFGTMRNNNDENIHCIYSYNLNTPARAGWVKEFDSIDNDGFIPRYQFTAAPVSDKIYIFGGNGSEDPSLITIDGQVFGYFAYDSNNKLVYHEIKYSDGPEPRYGASMIAMGTTLYLFGGDGEIGTYNDLWKYDTSAKAPSWEKIEPASGPETPPVRCFHNMHAYSSKEIWVLGGMDFLNRRILNDLWMFDLETKKWTKKADAPTSFENSGSVLVPGKDMKIYVWGGFSDDNGPLPNNIIYEYTTASDGDDDDDDDDDDNNDGETGKSGCGLLGIEFVILALLGYKMRRKS